MTYKKISGVVSLLLFAIIVYWAFIRPKLTTKKSSFNGRVISITKKKRSGSYDVKLQNGDTNFVLIYNFMQDTFDIKVGDSVFKKSDSETLYIKQFETGLIKPANELDFLVPPRAKSFEK